MLSKHIFREHRDRLTKRDLDLGLHDDKQRAIGARVYILPITVEPNPHANYGQPPADDFEIGAELFKVNVQPTRDGRVFGASQPGKIVASLLAVNVEIERRVNGMRKRYVKMVQPSKPTQPAPRG